MELTRLCSSSPVISQTIGSDEASAKDNDHLGEESMDFRFIVDKAFPESERVIAEYRFFTIGCLPNAKVHLVALPVVGNGVDMVLFRVESIFDHTHMICPCPALFLHGFLCVQEDSVIWDIQIIPQRMHPLLHGVFETMPYPVRLDPSATTLVLGVIREKYSVEYAGIRKCMTKRNCRKRCRFRR